MACRPLRLLCLLCISIFLSGCASQPSAGAPGVTLPPVTSKRTAPENDINQSYSQTALLYLPSLDGTRLVSIPETVKLSAAPAPKPCARRFLPIPAQSTPRLWAGKFP